MLDVDERKLRGVNPVVGPFPAPGDVGEQPEQLLIDQAVLEQRRDFWHTNREAQLRSIDCDRHRVRVLRRGDRPRLTGTHPDGPPVADRSSSPPGGTVFAALAEELTLPCGLVLRNRLVKAAMSEQLADRHGRPTTILEELYRRWARGGAALLITGNAMVDGTQLSEPYNLVVEHDSCREGLSALAAAAHDGDAPIWLQLNHPGRQSSKVVSSRPVAPSAVPMGMLPAMFAQPRVLDSDQIQEIIDRFARSASIAAESGFDGVQVHAAHGYLINQFLSPLTNRRTDRWGGSLADRSRLLLEVIEAIQQVTPSGFAVGVKLNSADFQRGGFSEEESMTVVSYLEASGIDLLEVSGGTYEAPAMLSTQRASTREREAYFLDYVHTVRSTTSLSILLTGGFRTPRGMEAAVAAGNVDLVGLARPLTLVPDLPGRVLSGEAGAAEIAVPTPPVPKGTLQLLSETPWYVHQMRRLGQGRDPQLLGRLRALAQDTRRNLGWRLSRTALRRSHSQPGRVEISSLPRRRHSRAPSSSAPPSNIEADGSDRKGPDSW